MSVRGHDPTSAVSFVGAAEQRKWNSEADRFRGFEIDPASTYVRPPH